MGKVGTNHLAQRHCPPRFCLKGGIMKHAVGPLKNSRGFFPSSNSKEDNAIGRIRSGVNRSTFDLKPWTLRTFSISSKN